MLPERAHILTSFAYLFILDSQEVKDSQFKCTHPTVQLDCLSL